MRRKWKRAIVYSAWTLAKQGWDRTGREKERGWRERHNIVVVVGGDFGVADGLDQEGEGGRLWKGKEIPPHTHVHMVRVLAQH